MRRYNITRATSDLLAAHASRGVAIRWEVRGEMGHTPEPDGTFTFPVDAEVEAVLEARRSPGQSDDSLIRELLLGTRSTQ